VGSCLVPLNRVRCILYVAQEVHHFFQSLAAPYAAEFFWACRDLSPMTLVNVEVPTEGADLRLKLSAGMVSRC
jgi:hypothetical protein